MIRLELTIPFPPRVRSMTTHSSGETANLLGFNTNKILSKLNMGAIIGYILCNTFWTAQGSLWPTVGVIPWDDLPQCNKLSNTLPGKGPCKPNQHSGTEWVVEGTSTPAVLWASHCPRAVQQKAGSLPRRCGKDMARAESHPLAVKQSVSCRTIAKADEICQEGREGGKSFSRRSPQLRSSRHSHSWL